MLSWKESKRKELMRNECGYPGLRELYEMQISRGIFPGAAVNVMKNGEISENFCLGMADIENKIEVKNNTIFRLYSLTKPVTAVAAMILWEKGKLDFSQPLSDYFPEYAHMKVWTEEGEKNSENPLLLSHLMSMTSGLVYPSDVKGAGTWMSGLYGRLQQEMGQGGKVETQELVRMLAGQPLMFEPGPCGSMVLQRM